MTNAKRTPEPSEQFLEAARRTDPLFGDHTRDFQPTIEQLITMIDIHGEPYDPPSGRHRVTFSLRPDLVANVQKMAADHDMPASAMVDALLRVALGDWEEWWHHHSSENVKTAQENKK